MASLLRLLSLRQIALKPSRALLTALGIAAGVALYVSVSVINAATMKSFRQSTEAIAGKASLTVLGPEAGFPEELFRKVAETKGVEHAVPLMETRALYTSRDGTQRSLVVFGVDVTEEAAVRTYKISELKFVENALSAMKRGDSVILTHTFCDREKLDLGSTLELSTAYGKHKFTVQGILTPEGAAQAYGGEMAVVDIFTARAVFGKEGLLDRIDVVVAQDESPSEVAKRVQAVLGPGFRVGPPKEQGTGVARVVESYQALLSSLSLVALLVALFLVSNTVTASVTERRREIAMLRAIGATRARVVALFVGEALAMGIVGTLAGVFAGRGLAALLANTVAGSISAFAKTPIQVATLAMTPKQMALAALFGAGASALVALVPALRAARVHPLEALRSSAGVTDAVRPERSEAESKGQSAKHFLPAWLRAVFAGASTGSARAGKEVTARAGKEVTARVAGGGSAQTGEDAAAVRPERSEAESKGQSAKHFLPAWLRAGSAGASTGSARAGAVGLALLVLLPVLVWLPLRERPPILDVVEALCALGGALLGGAWLIRAGIRLVRRPLASATGRRAVVLRLACDNLLRPRRTGGTEGLLASIILIVMAAATSQSFAMGVGRWFDRIMQWDLLVTSPGNLAGGQTLPLHESIGEELATMEGIEKPASGRSPAIRYTQISYSGAQVSLKAFDPPESERDLGVFDYRGRPLIAEGKRLFESPEPVAMVSETFESRFHVRKGDVLELDTPSGPTRFAVIGIVTDFMPDGAIYVSREVFRRLWHDPLVSAFGVRVAKGQSPEELRARLEAKYGPQGLVVLANKDLRVQILSVMDQAFAFATILELAALLVSLFGLLNALLRAVLERTRELGLLRAVGMSRGQLVGMVVVEATLAGAMTGLVAVAVGLYVSWAWVVEGVSNELGWGIALQVPWVAAVAAVLSGVVIGALAAWLPARRASALDIREAIAYE